MALRIVLNQINSTANRYQRSIEPLLSLTVDFYVRLFIRVHDSPIKCHESIAKTSHVYQCGDCQSFYTHRLAAMFDNTMLVKK